MKPVVLLPLSLLCLITLEARSADSENPDASRCFVCHQGALDLASLTVEGVIAGIANIQQGAKSHPPLELADDSEAGIEALARQLIGDEEQLTTP